MNGDRDHVTLIGDDEESSWLVLIIEIVLHIAMYTMYRSSLTTMKHACAWLWTHCLEPCVRRRSCWSSYIYTNNTTKHLDCENLFWEPCARKGHKTRWRSWTTMKQAYDLWMIVIYFSWSHVHGNDSCELLSSKLTIDRELILFEPCAREAHEPIWSKLTVDCELTFCEPWGHIDADRAH